MGSKCSHLYSAWRMQNFKVGNIFDVFFTSVLGQIWPKDYKVNMKYLCEKIFNKHLTLRMKSLFLTAK